MAYQIEQKLRFNSVHLDHVHR